MSDVGVIDRLIEACSTGKDCQVRYEPRRFVCAISPGGLGLLTRHKLWREAAQQIILKLDAVHPHAQRRFLDAWMRTGWMMRQFVDDDELFFTFLRKVLPQYHGDDAVLYRGQIAGARLEPSWSRAPYVALKFALVGDANVDPARLAIRGRLPKDRRPRENAVVLKATISAADIICGPCLLGEAEGEYVVDPRDVLFVSEPAEEAAIWISEYTKQLIS